MERVEAASRVARLGWLRPAVAHATGLVLLSLYFLAPWSDDLDTNWGYTSTGAEMTHGALRMLFMNLTQAKEALSCGTPWDRHRTMVFTAGRLDALLWCALPLAGSGLLLLPRRRWSRFPLATVLLGAGAILSLRLGLLSAYWGHDNGGLREGILIALSYAPAAVALAAVYGIVVRGYRWATRLALTLTVGCVVASFPTQVTPWGNYYAALVLGAALWIETRSLANTPSDTHIKDSPLLVTRGRDLSWAPLAIFLATIVVTLLELLLLPFYVGWTSPWAVQWQVPLSVLLILGIGFVAAAAFGRREWLRSGVVSFHPERINISRAGTTIMVPVSDVAGYTGRDTAFVRLLLKSRPSERRSNDCTVPTLTEGDRLGVLRQLDEYGLPALEP
jgi:hypothetical protein